MSTNLYAGGVFELGPDEALDGRESREAASRRSTSASNSAICGGSPWSTRTAIGELERKLRARSIQTA